MKSPLKNKTLIIGCGRLGSAIANNATKKKANVLVIDANPENFEHLDEDFSGYTFCGDATDLAVLEQAYITSAKEVIITTGNDNANIFLAHVARDIYDVENIYVRLDDPSKEVLFKGKKIKGIYPFTLSLDKYSLLSGGSK